jgi:hypothetical protein
VRLAREDDAFPIVLSGSCLPESTVILAGARDFDPPEESRLRASQIVHLAPGHVRSPETLVEAIRAVSPEITGLYVHLDLDVLDIEVARVNVYGSAGGLDGDQLDGLLGALMRSFPVRAVSLTAYDPASDVEERVPPIAVRLLRTVAESLSGSLAEFAVTLRGSPLRDSSLIVDLRSPHVPHHPAATRRAQAKSNTALTAFLHRCGMLDPRTTPNRAEKSA